MELLPFLRKDPKPAGTERKSTEDEERKLRKTAGFINMRVVALMYVRAKSEDTEIQANATLAIEAIRGTLEMMMKGTTRFQFDTSIFEVGKVVNYDPDKFDLHFGEIAQGEKAVIVNPPMIEGDSFHPYTTKPTVVSLESVKSSADKYELAVTARRGVYLFD